MTPNALREFVPYSCNLSKFYCVSHAENPSLFQLLVISICLLQSCLQRIPLNYDLFWILVMLLHVVNILSSCL
jgi:hypothetical protein